MDPNSQLPRNGGISSLNAAIEDMSQARDNSGGVPPVKAVFGSVIVVLTMIRYSMTNDVDYVELGLACTDICRTLDRGMKGSSTDGHNESVFKSIAQLTQTVAEIQEKIIEKGRRNPFSRLVNAKNDREVMAAWRCDLARVLYVFNTELVANTHAVATNMHRHKLDAGPHSSRRLPEPPMIPPGPFHTHQCDGTGVFNEEFRPAAMEMYDRLGDFFPGHNLGRPVTEAGPGGTSPTSAGDSLQNPRSKTPIEQVRGVSSALSTAEPPSKCKPIPEWVQGELIGRGTYGKVYVAMNTAEGELFAVKQVEIPRTANDRNNEHRVKGWEALKLENKILKNLVHPNIVQYLGFEETPSHLSIFLEYVPGGSIASILGNHGRFNENVTKSFTAQILDGLDYLHSNGIIHRDLKSGNILVEESGLCKIANFGISKQADDIDLIGSHTSMQGSVFWMAPEVVDIQKKGHYNSKIDIWSVGCVVLEMWTGERPWSGREQYTVLFQLHQTKAGPPLPKGIELSPQADDLRQRCFAINPDERPNAAELRQHQYLALPPWWEFRGFRS